MKTQLSIAILFATAYVLSACNSANTNNNSDTTQTETAMPADTTSNQMNMDNGLMPAMNSMMDKMNSMQMTGDFDLDFANMMIEHHKGAVDMSQIEVSKGSDEKIKTMAQDIITQQTEEIKMLQDIVSNFKTPEIKNDTADKHNELRHAMKEMNDQIKGMQMTGNTDSDYVMMMIPHHESAVSMFKKEIKIGKNAQLKQMAQKGIKDQNKEIREFKEWLSSNK